LTLIEGGAAGGNDAVHTDEKAVGATIKVTGSDLAFIHRLRQTRDVGTAGKAKTEEQE
jgi:hypothetical protein